MSKLRTLLVDDNEGSQHEKEVIFQGTGTIICKANGVILRIDRGAFSIFDLDRLHGTTTAVQGTNVSELAVWPVGFEKIYETAGMELKTTCLANPIQTWRGTKKWLMISHNREYDYDLGFDIIRIVLSDTSTCRMSQIQRAQETAFYNSLIENSSAPQIVVDRNHRILVWNHACEELTGVESLQVVGTDRHRAIFARNGKPCLADLLVDGAVRDISKSYEQCSRSMVLNDGWRAEGWFENFNGKRRYLVMDAAPIYSGADHELMAVIQTMDDITEHMLAEERLRQKDEQLCQLQKMEAVGRLAGGIAHDFNNILTAIIGYSNLAMETLGPEHPCWADLHEVIVAGERATKLTKQLLALGRKQVMKSAPMNINEVVVEMSRLLLRTLGEHIEMIVEGAPDLWMIQGDPSLMEQIIMNLALNAHDAMPQGGKITISTVNVVLDRDVQHGDCTISSGKYVTLCVRDTGSGMSDEVKAHLFEPFFTTKEQGKGSGLGLSTIYGIVQQLKGWIDVASSPGLGTVFTLYFPACDAPVPPPDTVVAPSQVLAGTETILLAEDEDSLRTLVSRTLKGLGYHVMEAKDGEEGFELGRHCKEKIDLVLSDVVMPRCNGQNMVRRLREVRQDFKVIFCSGFTNGALVDHGLLEGTHELIVKPFTCEGLAQKIRAVLDNH